MEGRIAVTGTSSFLGTRLLRRLVEAHGSDAVVAVDIAAPPTTLAVRHWPLDLTEPASDEKLLDVFRMEDVRRVVHMAFFTSPRRDAAYAHELESIGTLALLAAAAAAGVTHVVQRSFTAVYGARGQNPSFLTEDWPLPSRASLGWLQDKLEAEAHASAFSRRYPEMRVSVVRLAPLFGPGVQTFYTRVFDKRLVPILMGYDPLIQLLHPDDALAALLLAVDAAPAGPLNVVPRRALPLLAALHMAGKVPLPVPHAMAYTGADLMWAAGLGAGPGGFLDFVRFPVLADGEKARRELGFEAQHSSRDALLAYVRYRYRRRRPAGGRAAAEDVATAPAAAADGEARPGA